MYLNILLFLEKRHEEFIRVEGFISEKRQGEGRGGGGI